MVFIHQLPDEAQKLAHGQAGKGYGGRVGTRPVSLSPDFYADEDQKSHTLTCVHL